MTMWQYHVQRRLRQTPGKNAQRTLSVVVPPPPPCPPLNSPCPPSPPSPADRTKIAQRSCLYQTEEQVQPAMLPMSQWAICERLSAIEPPTPPAPPAPP